MNKTTRRIIFWWLIFSVTIGNAENDSPELSGATQRIISLAPHLTELIYSAGAGNLIVGTVEHSDYPDAAQHITRIGDAEKISLERIISLRPDLIIAWETGTPAPQIGQLRQLGFTVYVSAIHTLEDIAKEIEQIGKLAGTKSVADRVAGEFRRRLSELVKRYSALPPRRIFYQVWGKPLISIAGNHLISQVIRICGGRNILQDYPGIAPIVSREAVIVADPEVIIASGPDAQAQLNEWNSWRQISAVAHANLFILDADLIQRPSHRILLGTESLCELIANSVVR